MAISLSGDTFGDQFGSYVVILDDEPNSEVDYSLLDDLGPIVVLKNKPEPSNNFLFQRNNERNNEHNDKHIEQKELTRSDGATSDTYQPTLFTLFILMLMLFALMFLVWLDQ